MRFSGGRAFLTCAALLVPASGAAAQALRPLTPEGEFFLLAYGVNETVAADQGFGSRGWGGGLGGGALLFEVLSAKLTVDLGLHSDKAQFQQSTTGGQKKSSVGFALATASIGLRTPKLPRRGVGVSAGVNLGHGWIKGSRDITNCINCRVDALDVDGGSYLEGILLVGPVGVAYRRYSNGDLRSALRIGFVARPK